MTNFDNAKQYVPFDKRSALDFAKLAPEVSCNAHRGKLFDDAFEAYAAIVLACKHNNWGTSDDGENVNLQGHLYNAVMELYEAARIAPPWARDENV